MVKEKRRASSLGPVPCAERGQSCQIENGTPDGEMVDCSLPRIGREARDDHLKIARGMAGTLPSKQAGTKIKVP